MNIQRAIQFLYPGVKYMFDGVEDYNFLIWPMTPPKPTMAALQAVDLAAAQTARISLAKSEAAVRISVNYPVYAQINAALGLYDTLPNTDPFFPANMKAGIQVVIDAERAAETAINALTDATLVDSFTW